MFFEYPKLLWLLVIPALLVLHYIYLELSERHPHLRVSTSVPWMASGRSFMAMLRHVPFILRIFRSEERRVGKECRSRWSPYH